MFTRLLRHVYSGETLSFSYRSMSYGPGSSGVDPSILDGHDNAILDYRFSTSPQLTWYFDHHVSAFPSEADRVTYAEGARENAARKMFHDGAYGSCTKLIADIGAARFGLNVSGDADLIRWADMIDSAAFPSAEMAVARAEPVLHLMAVVEQGGDDRFLQTMVPRLLEEPLEEVARGADIHEKYAPLAAAHDAFVTLIREHAKVRGHVVVVDLSAASTDMAAKFVTYALWPESAYSVLLTRSPSKCKISIGYNPWSSIARTHNIAAICERHGGGGHPVVGAISLPANQAERARELMNEIVSELEG